MDWTMTDEQIEEQEIEAMLYDVNGQMRLSIDMATVHSNTEVPLKMSITERAEQRVIDTMMKTDPICAAAQKISDEPVRKEVHFPYTLVRNGKGGFVPGAKKLLYGYKGESMFEFPKTDLTR
jgi:hypothetical protein